MININYINKSINKDSDDNVSCTIISYEITQEDAFKVVLAQSKDEHNFYLTKDNISDLLIDNSQFGRFITVAQDEATNNCILTFYIVTRGLDKFLQIINNQK